MLKMQILQEFKLEDVPFPVVDPRRLSPEVLALLDSYMAGRTVPHPLFIYAHDYAAFCNAVERGDIKIEAQ